MDTVRYTYLMEMCIMNTKYALNIISFIQYSEN